MGGSLKVQEVIEKLHIKNGSRKIYG